MSFENSSFAHSLYMAGTPQSHESFGNNSLTTPSKKSTFSNLGSQLVLGDESSKLFSPADITLKNFSRKDELLKSKLTASKILPNFDEPKLKGKLFREVKEPILQSKVKESLPVTPNAAQQTQLQTVPEGKWEHPSANAIRSRTIDKRQALSALLNALFHVFCYKHICGLLSKLESWVKTPDTLLNDFHLYLGFTAYAIKAYKYFIIFGICWNIYKFLKPKDAFVDLQLTPSQRKLMGLPTQATATPIASSEVEVAPKYIKNSILSRYSPKPFAKITASPSVSSPLKNEGNISFFGESPFKSNLSKSTQLMTPSKPGKKISPESPLANLQKKLTAEPSTLLLQNSTSTSSENKQASSTSGNPLVKPLLLGSTTNAVASVNDIKKDPSFSPSGRYQYMSKSPQNSFR